MLMIVLVWTIIYYLDYINHYDRIRRWAGAYDSVWAGHGYLWPVIDRESGLVLAPSPYNPGVYAEFLLIGSLPTFLLLALCVAFPTPEIAARLSGSPNTSRARDCRAYLLGVAAAALIYVPLTIAFGWRIARYFGIGDHERDAKLYHWFRAFFDYYRGLEPEEALKLVPMNMGAIIVIVISLAVNLEIIYLHRHIWPFALRLLWVARGKSPRPGRVDYDMSPGLAICLLFIYFYLLYFLLLIIYPSYRFWVVLGGCVWAAAANSRPFKYRFPPLDYKSPKIIFDLRVMPWGDGSEVPTSGQDLVIVGTNDEGLLHIRTFDPAGVRTDTYEKKDGGALHLITEGPSSPTDLPESSLPKARAQAIASLKQQLPGLVAPAYAEQRRKEPGPRRGDINRLSDPHRPRGGMPRSRLSGRLDETAPPRRQDGARCLEEGPVSRDERAGAEVDHRDGVGGAYRASFWSTIVLEELSRFLQDGPRQFFRHVRLMTGASGGMVGSAYLVALLLNSTVSHD